jgi:predicted nicotinamide N-methyase
LKLGSHPITLLKVADIDALLERLSDPDQIPFWAELWPASIGLAHFITRHAQKVQGLSVLELGAGVGLAGIAAKLAGACVTQSDCFREALRFSEINCRQNHLPDRPMLLADWRDFPAPKSRFALVIGSDILYEKTLHDALLHVLDQTLAPQGAVWLADPGRSHAALFLEKAGRAGWSYETTPFTIDCKDESYRIDIYRLERAGNRNGVDCV